MDDGRYFAQSRREAETRMRDFSANRGPVNWDNLSYPYLNLNDLSLRTLPRLFPPGVERLSLYGCELRSIESHLPAGLRDLDLAINQLRTLPDNLPRSLYSIRVSQNQLSALPGNLPDRLGQLIADNNRLTTIPESLPRHLHTLTVGHNELRALPNNLPPNLRTLAFNNNQITALPNDLPLTLTRLNASNNQLRDIPRAVIRHLAQMSQSAEIDLTGNPLSRRTLARLDQILGARNYQGPTILYSRPEPAPVAVAPQASPARADAPAGQPHRPPAPEMPPPARPTAPRPPVAQAQPAAPSAAAEPPEPVSVAGQMMQDALARLSHRDAAYFRSIQQNAADAGAPMDDAASLELLHDLFSPADFQADIALPPQARADAPAGQAQRPQRQEVLPPARPAEPQPHVGPAQPAVPSAAAEPPEPAGLVGSLMRDALARLSPEASANFLSMRRDAWVAGNPMVDTDLPVLITEHLASTRTPVQNIPAPPAQAPAQAQAADMPDPPQLDDAQAPNPADFEPQGWRSSTAWRLTLMNHGQVAIDEFLRTLDNAAPAATLQNSEIAALRDQLYARYQTHGWEGLVLPSHAQRAIITLLETGTPEDLDHMGAELQEGSVRRILSSWYLRAAQGALAAQPLQRAEPVAPALAPVALHGLGASVAAWRPPLLTRAVPTAHVWQGFASEPGATAFAGFLDRLRGTVNFNSPEFQRSTLEWLTHLEHNPELRAESFAVSEGATATCEDRVSHTLNSMRQLRLASDVRGGTYDQRLPELVTLARGMFRLDRLENIARQHIASHPNVDQIEVYLGLQVGLREPLNLPLDTTDMRYFGFANLLQTDLNAALDQVLDQEQRGFIDYLATEWQPWEAMLQRQAPQEYEQTQDHLIDAMGDEFSNRLKARLQEIGLQNDADAERTLGPQVQAEIAREIKGTLTRDFLHRNGLLDQLR